MPDKRFVRGKMLQFWAVTCWVCEVSDVYWPSGVRRGALEHFVSLGWIKGKQGWICRTCHAKDPEYLEMIELARKGIMKREHK